MIKLEDKDSDAGSAGFRKQTCETSPANILLNE